MRRTVINRDKDAILTRADKISGHLIYLKEAILSCGYYFYNVVSL